MKKRQLFFILTLISVMFVFAMLAGATEITTYTDAESKPLLTYVETELVTFADGFTCPSYYIFENSTEFKTNYEWLNTKASKSYTDADVKELCIPTGILTGGYFKKDSSFTALTKLNTGKTLTKTNGDFWNNQTLEIVIFGEGFTNAGLGAYFITGGKVTHIIFADNSSVTTLPTKFFAGLSTLQGIYFGNSITNIGSGTFQDMGSSNVYLMNTPEDREAPSVYYFKTNLLEGNFYGFKTNATTIAWVFPQEQKGVGSGWNIDNSSNIPKNFVFLTNEADGVVVNDTIGSSKLKNYNIYFPNLKSTDTGSITVTPSASYYFGDAKKIAYNGSWESATDMLEAEHIIEAPKTTAPTCEQNSYIIEACFCKTISSSVENKGTALGHDYVDDKNCVTDNKCSRCEAFEKALYSSHNMLESYSYPNGYGKFGLYTCECTNGDCTAMNITDGDEDSVLAPIIRALGYSVKETTNDGLCVGYEINISALNEYNTYLGEGNELQLGVIIANSSTFGNEFMSLIDGKYTLQSSKGIQVEISGTSYRIINCKITGFDTDEKRSLSLVMAMYVVDKKGVSYVQSQNTSAVTVTKNDITLNTVTISSVISG